MSTQALDIHAGKPRAHRQAGDQPAYWSGVFAMTLCAFALVASEFMPVSLLTPVAADLHISEGLAGQAISVSGVFAVLTSLFISALAGKASRKTLLLGMTALMFLSAPIIALAPNYATYMAGRVFLGVAIGGFWSMSAASAMRSAPTGSIRDSPRSGLKATGNMAGSDSMESVCRTCMRYMVSTVPCACAQGVLSEVVSSASCTATAFKRGSIGCNASS